MHYPSYIIKLIEEFKKLPGIGSRTAERFAFHLLNWDSKQLIEMSNVIDEFRKNLKICSTCGCLVDESHCIYCDSSYRNNKLLCIIASPKDVFSIEATHKYSGMYHVLGGLLSPMKNMDPDTLFFSKIKERILKNEVEEVIVALDSTIEGDATALYLRDYIESDHIKISRLAFGIPIGSTLDYVDAGTLTQAISGRQSF